MVLDCGSLGANKRIAESLDDSWKPAVELDQFKAVMTAETVFKWFGTPFFEG